MAESTKLSLSASIISADVTNHELLKVAYEAYLANARSASARTKTRGEVSGGGRKPWAQKGTGRARFGSTRNPIWRTGGVVFGPTGTENYKKRLATNTKRTALRQALTLAKQADKLVPVATIAVDGKTKSMTSFLAKHKLTQKRILIVVAEKTPEILRSTSNLQQVEVVRATYMSVYHILNADKIVIDAAAIAQVNEWLAVDAKKKEAAS